MTGSAAPGYGTPKVKLPGSDSYVDLVPGEPLPPGTLVDLSGGGGIVLTDSTGKTMTFYGEDDGVPSVFEITGPLLADRAVSANGARPPVENLKLVGGDFSVCSKKTLRTKNPPPVRRVWGNGKGHYRTQGKYAAATISGTWWETVDRCDGTLVLVKRGSVIVRDFVQKKNHVVAAGRSYLARAPKAKKK